MATDSFDVIVSVPEIDVFLAGGTFSWSNHTTCLSHVDTEQPMLKVDNCTFVGTHVRTMGKTLVVDAALRDAPGSSAEPARAGSAAAAASTSAARSGEAAPHMEEDGTYVLPSGVVLRAATQHRIVFRLVEGRLEDLLTTA